MEEVVSKTGPHPIKFVTMQSLGYILIQKREITETIELLLLTRVEQEIYFGTEMQEDIAKTMHFLGEAFEANSEPLKALEAYKKSLEIKQTIKLSETITEITLIAIDKIQKTVTNADELNDTVISVKSDMNI